MVLVFLVAGKFSNCYLQEASAVDVKHRFFVVLFTVIYGHLCNIFWQLTALVEFRAKGFLGITSAIETHGRFYISGI